MRRLFSCYLKYRRRQIFSYFFAYACAFLGVFLGRTHTDVLLFSILALLALIASSIRCVRAWVTGTPGFVFFGTLDGCNKQCIKLNYSMRANWVTVFISPTPLRHAIIIKLNHSSDGQTEVFNIKARFYRSPRDYRGVAVVFPSKDSFDSIQVEFVDESVNASEEYRFLLEFAK